MALGNFLAPKTRRHRTFLILSYRTPCVYSPKDVGPAGGSPKHRYFGNYLRKVR